jgi:RNA polymerase sigma-70 factor (ECF subfamily)
LIAKGVTLDRARDIAQETWTRLIEQQRAGKLPRIELPGLAITQASFLALDDARRRRRGPRPLDDAPEADVQDPRANAEEQLVTREQIERAITELERCSPQAKRVFSLVYEGAGRPHADAARTLGISVQRVRQTLCEVRARLRGALEKNHG